MQESQKITCSVNTSAFTPKGKRISIGVGKIFGLNIKLKANVEKTKEKYISVQTILVFLCLGRMFFFKKASDFLIEAYLIEENFFFCLKHFSKVHFSRIFIKMYIQEFEKKKSIQMHYFKRFSCPADYTSCERLRKTVF